jgi:arylsulfatase A
MISFQWFFLLLPFVIVSCSSENSRSTVLQNARPNTLLIVADDLGYEKLGCYGGINTSTPNLDALAEKGVLFENAYTSPVCTPSRMSIYTGSYEPRHQYSKVLPVHLGTKEAVDFTNRFTCYAKLLRNAGYLTSVTGKWQLAALEHHPDHIKSAGFDSWCVWQIWHKNQKTTRYWNPTLNHDGEIMKVKDTDFGSDLLTDYVIGQMRSAKEAGKPFLIHHNMMLPHWPIIQTPADKEKNREAGLDNMISYMDLQVGKLMDAISELGIEENTIVFFAGDNGTDMNEPRQTLKGTVTGGKFNLNHGGMHVPLIAVASGLIPENKIVDNLVDFVDFFPTFCELAKVEIPKGTNPDGISFVDPLLGKGTGQRKWVTGGINDDFCVFDGQWRLHHKNDSLVDCRELPLEKPADMSTNEAKIAKARLLPILNELRTLRTN